MRIYLTAFILGIVFLTGCATKPPAPMVAQLDMSAYRKLEGSSKLMVAEVIYIQELISKSELYRYEFNNRKKLNMDSYVQILAPGYYQVFTVCTQRNFASRMAGLIEIEKKNDGTMWGRFQTGTGNDVLLPVAEMTLDLQGTETIVPLNMSSLSNSYCNAIYGEGKLNETPQNMPTSEDYLDKYGKKTTLYGYW